MLPLDLQRTVINHCISHKVMEMEVDGERHILPHLLQITYRCNDSKCNYVISIRFFKQDVVSGAIKQTRPCPECRKRRKSYKHKSGSMYISHKTAVLDYYLGPTKRKKRKGLEKFLFKQIQESKEQFGPSVEDI